MRLIDADALTKKLIPLWNCHDDSEFANKDIWQAIEKAPTIESEPHWIPCSERMPECEQEVLICTKKWNNSYIVTPAIYEDGTMSECDSIWNWQDIDYEDWDEENDCGIIPEGWFENRHFNPDDVYNNPVDTEVIAWMPLPEPFNPDDFSQHMNTPED